MTAHATIDKLKPCPLCKLAGHAIADERDAFKAGREGWKCLAEALWAERDALRQSLWDVYAALGCDTDGDPTPAAFVGDLGALVLAAAKESAQDYRDACDAAYAQRQKQG